MLEALALAAAASALFADTAKSNTTPADKRRRHLLRRAVEGPLHTFVFYRESDAGESMRVRSVHAHHLLSAIEKLFAALEDEGLSIRRQEELRLHSILIGAREPHGWSKDAKIPVGPVLFVPVSRDQNHILVRFDTKEPDHVLVYRAHNGRWALTSNNLQRGRWYSRAPGRYDIISTPTTLGEVLEVARKAGLQYLFRDIVEFESDTEPDGLRADTLLVGGEVSAVFGKGSIVPDLWL